MKGFTFLIFAICIMSSDVWAAGPVSPSAPPANVYVSETDRLLTIHKIGVLPGTDNVNGLYARYVEDKLGNLVKNAHRFDLGTIKDLDPRTTLDDYESDPALVKKIGTTNNVEALLGVHVNKLKTGVEIIVDLFLSGDGNLFAQETFTTENRFGVAEVENKTGDLFAALVKKLPYSGLILSRQGNRVTMDLGTRDGVHDNMIVSIEQVILLKRHPKFHFILASEKELLGKIRIVKADETLSFGTVLSEKDAGVIATDSKVTGLDFVNYADPSSPGQLQPGPGGDMAQQSISFGKHPQEWLPPKLPTLGKIGIGLGLGSDQDSMNLASGNLNAGAGLYPQLDVSGEIWLTPNWYAAAEIGQGVMSVSNPGGSGPSSLGANNGHYDFHGGYRFLLQDDFFGPLIDVRGGLNKFSFSVDPSSPMTSINYSGFYIGLGGSAPVTVARDWYIDADLDLFILPSSSETAGTAGTSGNTANANITKFNIGTSHKLTNQFWIQGHIFFERYSTTYSDTGNSSQQQLITLLTGVEYMF